mgnify:CR=1 FL=1
MKSEQSTASATSPEPVAGAQRHTFLLRVWRDGHGEPWRASLLTLDPSEAQHFSSLAAFFSALWQWLNEKID